MDKNYVEIYINININIYSIICFLASFITKLNQTIVIKLEKVFLISSTKMKWYRFIFITNNESALEQLSG
jgi:hypothetical protein